MAGAIPSCAGSAAALPQTAGSGSEEWPGKHELATPPGEGAGSGTAQTPVRLLVQPAPEPAPAQDPDPELEAVKLADPGPVLRGPIVLRADLREGESVAWVEYHACPSGTCEWQVLCRSEEAPFTAAVDTTALRDGDYDLRIFVGRCEGQIEGSRTLRGRAVENTLVTVLLRQPQPGASVAGPVALDAQVSPACAEIHSLRFEFSSDGDRWRPLLRAARTGPRTAIWYTTGLRDGEYLLRAVANVEAGARVTSEAVAIHLADT